MKKLILPILIAVATICQAQDPGTFIPAHYNSQGIFIPGHYEKYDESGVPPQTNPYGVNQSRSSSVGKYGGSPLYAPVGRPVQYVAPVSQPMSAEQARYLAQQRLQRQQHRQYKQERARFHQYRKQQDRAKRYTEKRSVEYEDEIRAFDRKRAKQQEQENRRAERAMKKAEKKAEKEVRKKAK